MEESREVHFHFAVDYFQIVRKRKKQEHEDCPFARFPSLIYSFLERDLPEVDLMGRGDSDIKETEQHRLSNLNGME